MSSTSYRLTNHGRHDPLRRFTSTPHVAQFTICGRTISLETNSAKLLKQAAELFEKYPSPAGDPQFHWSIVVQNSPEATPPWPRRRAFSDGDLRYLHFGQSSFAAVDLNRRRAIAFLSEGLAGDPLGLVSPFLDNLFCLSAASLGLTAIFAACVGSAGRGVIIMATPNNGKTTASYIAAKNGLRFHADRAVFLEMKGGRLLGWGDFSPAAFRSETLQFLPELGNLTQPFQYCDFVFHYFDKRVFEPAGAEPVIPVCCVFLRRGVTAEPQLAPLSQVELRSRLAEFSAFHEDRRFHAQETAVFDALAGLPAYELAYDEDPATAAGFFTRLLTGSERNKF
jgi:hypothetical protein